MKKIVSVLCTAAMLASAVALPASAAEAEEAANYTITEGYYYQRDNDIVPDDAMTVVIDTVDGVEQPVIKLDIISDARDFGINFADVQDGDYVLTIKYYAPNNLSQSKFGLRRGTPNWMASDCLTKTETYKTFSRAINISDNNNSDYQYARLRISTPTDTTGICYIAEFKLQRVLDGDGPELGDNILPDLFVKNEEPTPETKKLEMPALDNSVTGNTDGTFNKGFVTDNTFTVNEYNALVFGITEGGVETYKKYNLPTEITGESEIMLGVALQNIPTEYSPENIKLYLTYID